MSIVNSLAIPGPLGNLEAYKRQAQQYPELSAEEERQLAERYRAENDLDAAFRLIVCNLRLPLKVAYQYTGYGLPIEDLIQEGNVGLMKAAKRFDPSRGVRFFKYALLWIRAEVHDYILRNWRIVRVATTQSKRKLFYKLRSAKKALRWLSVSEADEIAQDLGVPTQDVLDMDMRLYATDAAVEKHSSEDTERLMPCYDAVVLADRSMAPDRLAENQEHRDQEREQLIDALRELDMRSKDIVVRRWLSNEKTTLQELGDEYGLSAERVRQIEKSAIGKLRQIMSGPIGR
jgi:RNA polymerase sigma-32 factor